MKIWKCENMTNVKIWKCKIVKMWKCRNCELRKYEIANIIKTSKKGKIAIK